MATRERPLSPHLQVYRWQMQMVTSILHRATGVFLSLGVLVIAAGLLALMFGPEPWDYFQKLSQSLVRPMFLACMDVVLRLPLVQRYPAYCAGLWLRFCYQQLSSFQLGFRTR